MNAPFLHILASKLFFSVKSGYSGIESDSCSGCLWADYFALVVATLLTVELH